MTETRVRTLTAEQSLRLLSARRAVPAGLPADLLLRQAAAYLASILGAAVVFAGWRDGRWSILGRSSSGFPGVPRKINPATRSPSLQKALVTRGE